MKILDGKTRAASSREENSNMTTTQPQTFTVKLLINNLSDNIFPRLLFA